MTRGLRQNCITKGELVRRLVESSDVPDVEIDDGASLPRLLGHAMYYGLVTADEIVETVPRNETTLPCYLATVIPDEKDRSRLDRYVVASSDAFRRGTFILNRIAQQVCGPRLPGGRVSSFDVPVFRPRFEDGSEVRAMQSFVGLFDYAKDITECGLKHAFMPERFGDLNAHIANAISTDALLPGAPAGWRDVMIGGNLSGWDNAINRMMTRFFGNVKVQAMKSVKKAIKGYMSVVPLHTPDARELLLDSTLFRLRPLIVDDADWAMAMAFRLPLIDEPDLFMPKDAQWSKEVFLIHLFLTRFGVAERSYLPVGSMGRQYAYLDSKIASQLLQGAKGRHAAFEKLAARARMAGELESERAKLAEKRAKEDARRSASEKVSAKEALRREAFDEKEARSLADLASLEHAAPPKTPTLGELIGMSPDEFNARRKRIVLELRKRNTAKATSKGFLSENRRKRFKKAAKHRKRVGYGKMSVDTRFDSLETDSFGVRLVLKTRIDMEPLVAPIVGPVVKDVKAKPKKRERISKKEREIRALNASEQPQETDPVLKTGIVVGIDEGRAKHFTAACLKRSGPVQTMPVVVTGTVASGIVTEPQANCDYGRDAWVTTTLTRNKYNAVTKLKIRRKWEAARIDANPDLRNAYDALSLGSLRSCDPGSWEARFRAESVHESALRADLFGDKERERWKMIAFRKKKACLDRAVGEFVSAALKGEPKSRPLVVGIGDAAFPPNGPRGEIAVPTSKLAAAYKRAFDRVRRTGRRVAVFPISEKYTTKTCCDCGSVTEPPMVQRTWRTRDGTIRTEYGESRRLRCCRTCTPIGKLRDRDVQAARNMQRATVALINGRARPAHLCRATHEVEEAPAVIVDVRG